jgi:osmotically-inducible protein OsmY
MAETQAAVERTDLDIVSDIDHFIAQYPPLVKDRHGINVEVRDGQVTVTGHVQTPNTRRYFLDLLPDIVGVRSVDADHFYDDESIRLEIGKAVPVGVKVGKIQHGVVILVGKVPAGSSAASIVAPVQQIAGVVQVIPGFR